MVLATAIPLAGATAGDVHEATGGGDGSSDTASSAVSGITASNVFHIQGDAVTAQFGEEGQTSEGFLNGAGYAMLTVVSASATAAPEPGTIMPALTAGTTVPGVAGRRKKIYL